MPKPLTFAGVAAAHRKLKRRGSTAAMEQLLAQQGPLAEYLLEELSAVHGQLMELGASPRRTQRAYRRVRDLVLLAAPLRR